MTTATVDTNVVASGVVGIRDPVSPPAGLPRAWQGGRFTLVMSGPMLAEFERTLTEPYFQRRRSEPGVADAIEAVRRNAMSVAVTVPVYGVAIRTPREFLDLLEELPDRG